MAFRHRLTLFLVIALIAVQGAMAFVAYAYLRGNAIDKGKRDLEAASGIFMRQLNLVSDRVTDGVKVLSLDYALRQSIAQEDHGTELSALRNHGHRIGATRMMLISLDGRVSADTGTRAHTPVFPFPDLLGEAMESDQSTTLATLGDELYWIVVVPVRAPLPIAFVAACIPIDDALLQKFSSLGTTPRSIGLAVKNHSGAWSLVAKTGNHPADMPLPGRTGISREAKIVQIGGANWLTATAPLRTEARSDAVAVVLGYPLQATLNDLHSLLWPMLLIFAVALLIALVGSTMIVGGMARPLEALAATARRIAANDYTPPEPIHEAHELGQLSQALINMTHSIAEREGALTAAISSLEIARNEAVRANEAKSQFLANMSHELRTPLNAIVGFGDMLSGEVLGPLGKPRYVEYARDISGSGQHLLTLVSRMLDLAESEAGRLQISHTSFSIAGVVERLVIRFQALADRNGVTLGGPSNVAVWPILSGDTPKLEQAIAGVLHNAIKFTPAGGHVDISGEWRDARFAVIVADSGIGMDSESIATVVRPFQRLRSALDGQHQGAGLGLSFAKAIVEAHEGTLRIESLISVGTRVEMEFPAQAATKGTKHSAARSVA